MGRGCGVVKYYLKKKHAFYYIFYRYQLKSQAQVLSNNIIKAFFAKAGMLGFIDCFQIQDVPLKYIRNIVKIYFKQISFELKTYISFASHWVERKQREETNYRKQLQK